MPKGVANDPTTDKRRQSKAGGRPATLPPGTHVWHVRVTWHEREELAAHLAQIRADWARRREQQGQEEETK